MECATLLPHIQPLERKKLIRCRSKKSPRGECLQWQNSCRNNIVFYGMHTVIKLYPLYTCTVQVPYSINCFHMCSAKIANSCENT